MFKCNICSKDAKYIYRILQNGENRNIEIDGKIYDHPSRGHIFLCKDHYIIAVDGKW